MSFCNLRRMLLATIVLPPGHARGLRRVLWVAFALMVVLQTGLTTIARAQTDRVDAGSFSIEQQGHRVGREQFSLRKAPAPDGSAFELRSESVSGDRRVAVQLTTDSMGSPVRYSLEIREGTRVTVRAGGQRLRSRFTTQVVRPTGESVREYLLVPGLIVLETDFYHQLEFVLRGRALDVGKAVELTALSLLDNTQRQLRLLLESREDSVTIAGIVRPAFRWKLDDGAGLVRTLWGDAEGRLLRMTIPSRSIVVVRDAVPK
ncbi:MAG: hypothetical protein ABJB74_00695 [Gemmatimonas sp.]